jgi:hypothetical protein
MVGVVLFNDEILECNVVVNPHMVIWDFHVVRI